MSLIQLEPKEIKELEPLQLVELLRILIDCEIEKCSPREIKKLTIPTDIYIKDGGIDGIIEFGSKITFNSKWLQSQLTCFQSKAGKIDNTGCYNAMLKKQPRQTKGKTKKAKSKLELNEMVEDCFNQGGEYVLFTKDTFSAQSFKARETHIKKAIKDSGKSYSNLKIRIMDSRSISNWCNEHMAAIIFVKQITQKQLPIVCFNWEKWNLISTKEDVFNFSFTPALEELSNEIIKNISLNKSLRILGHSGIGKSRLIRETFSPNSSNKMASILSKNLIYVDLAYHAEEAIFAFINSNLKQNGIIILDNCKEGFHLRTTNLIESFGSLKLITIDNSFSERKGGNTLLLINDIQKETVKLIFEKELSHLVPNEINTLVNLSDGYPRMAEYIYESIENSDILNLALPFEKILENFVNKLIYGKEKENNVTDDTIFNVIQSVSLFKEFGFIDPSIKGVAENNHIEIADLHGKFISEELCKPAISLQEFNKIIGNLKKKREILKMNRYRYYVVPEPLAINLAAAWLSVFPLTHAVDLALKLKNSGLIESFCERLTTLDQISHARPIVQYLLSEKSPFSSAEELNTNVGSRIFRSLVVVDPETCLNVLNNLYNNKTKQELLEVNIGRKNLIVALEKLSFRDETFDGAVKLLFDFAVAENENIVNNATNQFLQLFHILLSGTEAKLDKRLRALQCSIEKNDEYIQLGIQALAHALRFDGFVRMGGAEKQEKFRPLQDYHPSREEVIEYWEQAINLLNSLSVKHPHFIDKIKEVLLVAIYPLIKVGKGQLIFNTIKSIYLKDSSKWEDLMEKLYFLKSRGDLSVEENNVLQDFFDYFNPKSLEDLLKLKVTYPSFRYESDDKGNYIDVQKIEAEKLAEEVSKDIKTLYPYLRNILTGPQKQAFSFGNRIGDLISITRNLIEKTIEELSKIESKQQNFEFLGGLLLNADENTKRAIIRRIVENENTLHNSFYLTRIWLVTKEDVFFLFKLVDEGKLPITHFDNFVYGRVLDKLSSEDVIELTRKVFNYSGGKWTALWLITQYSLDNEKKWSECIYTITYVISSANYLKARENIGSLSRHYWKSAITKILSEKNQLDDIQKRNLTKEISKQIADFITSGKINSYDNDLKEVIKTLIGFCFEIFFKEIKHIILSSGQSYLDLQTLLGGGVFSDQTSALFENPTSYSVVLKFCKGNGVEATMRILNLLKVSDLFEGEVRLHPLAVMILEEFHNKKEILDMFSGKLGRGGLISSKTSYYESQIKLLQPLLSHSNSNIKAWANKHNSYLNTMVAKERIKEEKELN